MPLSHNCRYMVKRNKPMISASVSPYLKEEAEKLVKMGKFGSTSDLVGIALAEFIGRYKREHYEPRESYEIEADHDDLEASKKKGSKRPVVRTTEYVQFK